MTTTRMGMWTKNCTGDKRIARKKRGEDRISVGERYGIRETEMDAVNVTCRELASRIPKNIENEIRKRIDSNKTNNTDLATTAERTI